MLGNDNSTPWAIYLSNIVWNAFYFYYVITIIIFANLIKSEGEQSEVLLVKLVAFNGSRKKVFQCKFNYMADNWADFLAGGRVFAVVNT